MRAKSWVPGVLMAAALAAAAGSPRGYTQAQPHVKQYEAPKRAHAEDEGERVFEQNCARCHRSPDGFSQRITGTIVRHMRVRANLSQHDEQVLLKYFNQ